IDTLFTEEEVGQWNEDISNYKSRKWSRKEDRSLPIIAKSHHEIEEYYTQQGELESILYYSTPLFNEKENKALIYQDKVSKSSEIRQLFIDRKSTRLNSSHVSISYAVFCLKKKK